MRNRNWGEIAGHSSFLLPFPFKRVWTLSKALGYAIQVQVTSIFGRLKARACTESKINLNPSWAYHKNYGERRSPRHTPMVSKIFGNTQCLSHSSSHGFLFFANPVKRSLRSLSLTPLSPQHHHSQTGVPLGSCRVSVETPHHPSSLDFPPVRSAAAVAACAQGKLVVWFYYYYNLGSASVELSGEVLSPPPLPTMSKMEPTMQLIFSALHSVTMCVCLVFFFGDEWLRADQKVTQWALQHRL